MGDFLLALSGSLIFFWVVWVISKNDVDDDDSDGGMMQPVYNQTRQIKNKLY